MNAVAPSRPITWGTGVPHFALTHQRCHVSLLHKSKAFLL